MLWGTDVIGSTGEGSNKGVFGGLWGSCGIMSVSVCMSGFMVN